MPRSPDQPTSTVKSRRRRAGLLVAARQAFEERGYVDTSVSDIIRIAGGSRASFYSYFNSKDDALSVLVNELIDDLFAAATQPVEPGATPFENLETTIRQFMYAYRDRAPLLLILDQATTVNDAFLDMRLAIRARFAESLESTLIERHRRRPDPDDLDPRITAIALGGMVEDMARGRTVHRAGHSATLSPGVHTVSFEGTNNDTPRTIDVLIELDGEPDPLASYGTYFEGFQPYEAVHVTYQGIDFLDLTANQDGGLLVEVPVPARGEIQLGVVGDTSGTTIDRAVDVAPLPVSQSLDSVVNTASQLGEAFPALGTEWEQVISLLSHGSQADSARSAARAVAQATIAVEGLDVDQVTGIPGAKAALVDWLLDIGQAYAGNEIASAAPDADGDKLDVARQLLGDADSDRSNGDARQAALGYRDATIAAFDSNWWPLTRYGIVAFDDVDLRNSSIGGRILSGDATTLRSWSVGSDLAVDAGRVDVGVGGVIDIANGSVPSGSVTYGTLGQISSVSVQGTVEQASLPLDLDSARDAVVAAVASIADAPGNGSWVDANPWWTTFRFEGTNPDVNVFDVEADQLENAHAVQIDAPPGALTVIRVSGDHYSSQQLSTISVLNSQGPSADAGNLIWVFTTASSVEIGPSLHWRGSILAPTATVTVHNSVPLDGSLIASSVLGAVTHHWLPPVDHPQMP